MIKINIKILTLSVALSLLLGVFISLVSSALFFLGATLAMLSVAAYSDVAGKMLGKGGGILLPLLAIASKLAMVIFILKTIGDSNIQGLLPFIMGLMIFIPAILLPGAVSDKSGPDPAS